MIETFLRFFIFSHYVNCKKNYALGKRFQKTVSENGKVGGRFVSFNKDNPDDIFNEAWDKDPSGIAKIERSNF